MKKIVALFFVLVLVLGCLTACGTPANNTSNTNNVEPEDPYAKWPEKDITLKVCYTEGGTADTCGRALAAEMSKYLGVNISVTNVKGGSGSICGQEVYAAKDDGYTWLGDVAHTASGWRPMDYADLSWEDYYGFYAGTAPYILFVNKDSKYNTYQELFDAMKADPNIKWGNAGLGSINQLTGQLMCDILGLKGNSLPFNGGREAANKVLAGEVVWSWCGASDVMDLAISGDIKVLGVCDSNDFEIKCVNGTYKAPSLLKDYPSLTTLEGLLYWGIRVPRYTNPTIIAKITEAFKYAVEQPSFKEYCANNALTPAVAYGPECDEMCARLESIYAWGLFDSGLGTVSPEKYQVPRITDFKFPANDRQKNANPWPATK